MLYGEKIKHHLKTEKNPINKMYLNELIINWNKVDVAMNEPNDSPILTMVKAISTYTKYLHSPKFKYSSSKKCGFSDDHDVFRPHYLYDIIQKILKEAKIIDNNKGMFIENTNFHTGISLERNNFKSLINDPIIKVHSSNKYFFVGIELDIQYRLATQKKSMIKTKMNIPLLVFYVEKCYTEKCFGIIKKLRKDMTRINPNTMLFCITESIDKKYLNYYSEIEDILYVVRCNSKNDQYNDLQPQVFLTLYNKIQKYVNKDYLAFDKIAQFGHIDLFNNDLFTTKINDTIQKDDGKDENNEE